MKFDFQMDSNEDLEYFKVLFFRNVGAEQNVFDFHLDDIMVRLQVSGLDGAQMITIGFFSVEKEGPHTTKMQFAPLADPRYDRFEAIQRVWGWNSNQAWGTLTHTADNTELAFETIREILYIVYKVNKLKAFI